MTDQPGGEWVPDEEQAACIERLRAELDQARLERERDLVRSEADRLRAVASAAARAWKARADKAEARVAELEAVNADLRELGLRDGRRLAELAAKCDELRAKLARFTEHHKDAQAMMDGLEAENAGLRARVADLESADRGRQLERIAQLTAHRVCCGTEHDPIHGKLHGYCVVCGAPWPCAYAGPEPQREQAEPAVQGWVSPAELEEFGVREAMDHGRGYSLTIGRRQMFPDMVAVDIVPAASANRPAGEKP